MGVQAHVVQRAGDRVLFDGIGFMRGVWRVRIHWQHHFRRCAPADLRANILGTQHDVGIKQRVGIAHQIAPLRHCGIPLGTSGRKRAAVHVIQRGLIHRHQAHPRARFNRHIADRHAAFHRQGANGTAGKFQRIAGATGGTNLADDRQHHVFGSDAGWQRAVHQHAHVFHLLRHQTLSGQDVFHFRCADAMRQRAECTMRGGVRITADHGHTGQGGTLFGAHHMHDALAHIVHFEFEDAEIGAVFVQGLHLHARYVITDRRQATGALNASGGHVVVGRGDIGRHPPRFAPGQPQTFKRLRRGHFMQDVAVDVEQRRAIVAAHHLVHVPKLVVQGLAGHCAVS